MQYKAVIFDMDGTYHICEYADLIHGAGGKVVLAHPYQMKLTDQIITERLSRISLWEQDMMIRF